MAERICPVWIGYLLASPLRKLIHNPRTMLGPYIQPGMTALDVGCAMGFFSLFMADAVGPDGVVVCADLQEKMLQSLEKRARKAGVAERIRMRQCTQDSLNLHDLKGTVDFVLAFAMVHETPNGEKFFAEVAETLKPGGRLLFAEPAGHVTKDAFALSVSAAEKHGLEVVERPAIAWCHAVLMAKRS
jgi:2-polyprenyl-3-methyl-5-hydroxy-6-metoxy-1,4-benzoquinol methylase